jgi:hypothetical protein
MWNRGPCTGDGHGAGGREGSPCGLEDVESLLGYVV